MKNLENNTTLIEQKLEEGMSLLVPSESAVHHCQYSTNIEPKTEPRNVRIELATITTDLENGNRPANMA